MTLRLKITYPATFSNILAIKEDTERLKLREWESPSSEYVIQGKSLIGLILFLFFLNPPIVSLTCILAGEQHTEIVCIQLLYSLVRGTS